MQGDTDSRPQRLTGGVGVVLPQVSVSHRPHAVGGVARARAWRGYRGRGSEPHAERELEERGGASEASARGGSESGR